MAIHSQLLEKTPTGVDGFDSISHGGIPKGRVSLVCGTSGSAKTVFSCQFLAEGIKQFNDNGVMVTFEETPDAIRANMMSLGWDIHTWEENKKWSFVDASPKTGEAPINIGDFDLEALISRIKHAIKKNNATRVCIDSLGTILNQLKDPHHVRTEVLRLTSSLKALGVTSILTLERTEEYGSISRYGVEEFASDNVIIFRNILEEGRRKRTVEILKFRGTTHQKGEFSFSIIPNHGIKMVPYAALPYPEGASITRNTTGCKILDDMCKGGFIKGSTILISGPTGVGKTTLTSQFTCKNAANNKRCLHFTFEESPEQLALNTLSWDAGFEKLESQGTLKIISAYPEIASLEYHLVAIKDHVDAFQPDCLVIDSLSALSRIASLKNFQEFIMALTAYLKHKQVTAVFSFGTSSILGLSDDAHKEAKLAMLVDTVILLKHVEVFGELKQGIITLKMRGSSHEKEIRELSVSNKGIQIGKPFKNIAGILSGTPIFSETNEIERIDSLFSAENDPHL